MGTGGLLEFGVMEWQGRLAESGNAEKVGGITGAYGFGASGGVG